MTGPQIFLMLFGALLTLIGVAVFFALTWFKRGADGESGLKVLDKVELKVPHALVIFVGGMALMALPFFVPALSRPGPVPAPGVPTPAVTLASIPATGSASATPALPGKLQLRLAAIKLNAARKMSLLEKNPQMTQDDRYSLYFRPESAAYVYVFQYDCGDNETTVLFPNLKFSSLANPIEAGATVWLPQEDVRFWIRLDNDAPTSETYQGCDSKVNEKIIVMASKVKDQEAEAMMVNLLSPAPTPTLVSARPTPAPIPLSILLRAPDVVFVGETDLTNATVELPSDVKAWLAQGKAGGDRLLYRLVLNP